jgi:hypothetical protein
MEDRDEPGFTFSLDQAHVELVESPPTVPIEEMRAILKAKDGEVVPVTDLRAVGLWMERHNKRLLDIHDRKGL